MTCKELLLHETRRAHDWDEMCMLSAVRGLTTEVARREPEALWHQSIWQIIHHVAVCQLIYMKQAFGEPSEPIPEPGDTIESLLEYLDACYRYRLQCLERIDEKGLAEPVPTDWHGESAADLFWVMIQHDVNHAGQIVVLREALEP